MNLLMSLSALSSKPKFKQICTPQERWKKHLSIVKGNPNHFSAVVEKSGKSNINLKKPYMLFGVEKNCTINEFRQNIRKVLDLQKSESLVLFCNKVIPNSTEKMRSLEKFVESDGFLYFYLSKQESFG